MLNRIKNISIFVVVTFYVLQLCTLFSGSLVERIQEIRMQIQVSKIHLAEKKSIPLSQWNSSHDKKEFKINNIYYDVISFEILSDKVVINAVNDMHENNFRIVLTNLLNKKETPHSGKKKIYKTFHFITTLNNNDYKIESDYKLLSIKSNFYIPKGDINKIALTIHKPPC
ncbi:hypothetical protein [Flavobacterium sp.]|uniref:hypothetical protein n=1 Tax=Flavobacterium sp. TaxID=239 RepID=UPI0037527F6F